MKEDRLVGLDVLRAFVRQVLFETCRVILMVCITRLCLLSSRHASTCCKCALRLPSFSTSSFITAAILILVSIPS